MDIPPSTNTLSGLGQVMVKLRDGEVCLVEGEERQEEEREGEE